MAVAPAVADAFVIEGSRPLSGTIRAAGNKNGALPILAASLLADEPVTLANVPRIRDVETMLELLADLGADVVVDRAERGARRTRPDVVEVEPDAAPLQPDARVVPPRRAAARALRPCDVPPPGGDVIGRRRLDPHIHALRASSARVELGAAATRCAPTACAARTSSSTRRA